MIGSTISHYHITDKLGEGGMGVVYRAQDTKLHRTVALKFLPPHLAKEGPERDRFFHEARASATLNHSNITTIYEIDEVDDHVFIAMEIIEGQTLTDLIKERPLKISEALEIAIQAADGLAAAHAKEIVHRDVKPGNILLTTQNHVKITDFGLAKMQGRTKLTQTGSTIGTAAYMSPEQARGEMVDSRSDIFSFGIVLYEMLTSNLPFRGEHPAAVAYSIMNEQPQPLARFSSEVTLEIERIVSKALEKEAEDRYQHMDDMLADLRRQKKTFEYGHASGIAPPTATSQETAKAGPTGSRRSGWVPAVIGVGVISVLAVIYLLSPWNESVLNPNMTLKPLEIPFQRYTKPSISADGKWVAFAAFDAEDKWGLYFMNLDQGEPRRIQDGSGYVEISPDGSMICYNEKNQETGMNEVFVVPSLGGQPRVVHARGGAAPRFLPDGKRLGFILGYANQQANPSASGYLELWTVNVDGSDPRQEYVDSLSEVGGPALAFCFSPDESQVAWVRILPYGESFVQDTLVILNTDGMTYSELVVIDLEDRTERQVTFHKSNTDEPVWLRDSDILYMSTASGIREVWHVSADGGNPSQVTRGLSGVGHVRGSLDGKKVMAYQVNPFGHIRYATIDGTINKQITFDARRNRYPAVSPDGRLITFPSVDINEERRNLEIIDLDGRNRRTLLKDYSGIRPPIYWSPDGSRVLAAVKKQRVDKETVMVVDVTGKHQPTSIGEGNLGIWYDDHRILVFNFVQSYLVPDGGGEKTLLLEPGKLVGSPLFSGGYVMYVDVRKGTEGIYLTRLKGEKEDKTFPARKIYGPEGLTAGGASYSVKDGLIYVNFGTNGREIWKIHIPSGRKELVVGDVDPPMAGVMSMTTDGEAFYYSHQGDERTVTLLENVFLDD